MAIYTNTEAVKTNRHGVWEKSRIRSHWAGGGRIFDALVVDDSKNPIDVDNGVALKIGELTGNGLSEVYATIAKVGDKIAITGAPAIVKEAYVASQEAAYNFYNKAGKDVETYEIADDDYDIFCIASYQFTDASASAVKVGSYVVVDGKGMWVAQAAKPDAATHGFIGKIYQMAYDTLNFTTKVYIQAVQNKQVA